MPDTQTQERPAPVERGWTDSLSGWFTDRVADVQAMTGDTQAKAYTQIRDAERPADIMMSMMRNSPAMSTPEARTQLDTIQNDRNLMGALNTALGDNNVIRAMSEISQGADGGSASFMQSMQDPANRALMTRVLTRIGQSNTDDVDGDDLKEVARLSSEGNLTALDTKLQSIGISDTRVQMGATMQGLGIDVSGMQGGNVIGMMGNFVDNPESGIASWLNNPNGALSDLSPDTKAGIAGILQALIKFFGGAFKDFGAELSGVMEANAPGLIARGNEVLAGRDPDAAPRSRGPGDIQVAENIRPARGGAFQTAAVGEPNSDAPRGLDVARVDVPNYPGSSMRGAAVPTQGG